MERNSRKRWNSCSSHRNRLSLPNGMELEAPFGSVGVIAQIQPEP